MPDFNLDHLQQVMNAAASVISRRRKKYHISDVLQDLHWLRVPQRIEFKLYLTVYNALRNLAPSYLAGLRIPVTSASVRQRLRSSSAGNLVVPKPRTEFGKRAFAFAEPQVWNNLSQTIISSTYLAVFEKQLKTSFQTMLQTLLIFVCLLLFA